MCKFDEVLKNVAGAAWNSGIHAAGAWCITSVTALISGSTIGSTVASMNAIGSVAIGGGVGVVRSMIIGHHFGFSGISSKTHLSGETLLSLLTTFLGSPLGKKMLDAEVSDQDTYGLPGYPALTLWCLMHLGMILHHLASAENACSLPSLPSCPSLPSLPDCGFSLPKLSSCFDGLKFWKSNKEAEQKARVHQAISHESKSISQQLRDFNDGHDETILDIRVKTIEKGGKIKVGHHSHRHH